MNVSSWRKLNADFPILGKDKLMAKERINKINEEVRRELSAILREVKDSRIPMMTSVVAVNVTNDLSYAKVYVSVMGDEAVKKKALEGLKSASGFIRREIGRRVSLRHTPEFIFQIDNSIEHGAHINEMLAGLKK